MQQRNHNFNGDRKMSASFGQPNQSERGQYQQQFLVNQVQSPSGMTNQTAQNQFTAQSAQGSASRHGRIPSELMSASQRTEPAQNAGHIINMQAPIGVVDAGNISRKQSDFSFASGSMQKGPNSGTKSPRVVGSYANQLLDRSIQRAGSLSKRSNLNSSGSPGQSIAPQKQEVSGPQTVVSSKGSLFNSSRYPQNMVPHGYGVHSIAEEDNELDYGTQNGGSSSAPGRHIDCNQTMSSQVNQFVASSGNSTNVLSQTNPKPLSHLQSITAGSATLNPQIFSQDGTPTSANLMMRQHVNSNYHPQNAAMGGHRDSLPLQGSIDTSSNSMHLMQMKLDNSVRYSELCERRILDFQPDHPLPIREEYLGAVFAQMDINPTSGQKTNQTDSPSLPASLRQGFVNRFDQGADSASINSGGLQGSPRALRQHVDGLAAKNHQLEIALRQETLANEEQRNYIQILKNVIEQKLERDGLLEMLKDAGNKKRAEQQKQEFLTQQRRRISPSPDVAKDDEDAINLYVLLSDMKYQLDSKTKEVQRFIEQLKTQDEYSQTLLSENQQYQQELLKRQNEVEEVSKRYQSFEQELQILHKQKEDLLDCVENQVNQIDALKSDVDQGRSRVSTLEAQIRASQIDTYGRNSQSSQYSGAHSSVEQPIPQLNPPQIISHPADNLVAEVTSQSLINNGIDLSYSRELTSEANQTLYHAQQQLSSQQQKQHAVQEQMQIVNQAAINAAQQSITQKASQESVSQMSISHHGSTANLAIEQYQKHLQMKDQEIIKLRSDVDQMSSELFAKQQEADSLRFTESQLRKKLEMEQERTNSQEEHRAKQLDGAQSKLYEEQRRVEDLQLNYQTEIRKCQRELNIIREEQVEKDAQLEKIQKNYERQIQELELKEAQLETLRNQTSKDQTEIRELNTQVDEAKLESERLRKDRERRQDAELADGKTKEQLQREKNEMVNELRELQHQFEVFKTQKQTEAHRNDQTVRDAQTRVEVLEKASKKQIIESETLQRDYTQCAVKLKQSEVQTGYLESSNKQLTDELRQTKLEFDSLGREKQKLEIRIHDLDAQIETLNLRDGKNRKQHEQLNEAQLQGKSKDNEIEKLDDKLRKVYLQKEEFEVEAIQLRKTVHELQITKNEFACQREALSGQTKDNERRIFELIKDKQDSEKKVRENAIVIRDLVQERDNYKRIVSEKEDEIQELNQQVRQWRSTNTDLKLIEEKVTHFLNEVKHVVAQSRHAAKPQLQEFLRIVQASSTLSDKVSMRQREHGHSLLENLDQSERQVNQSLMLEGDQNHQSLIWQTMLSVKEKIVEQGNLQAYFTEMLLQFLAENVDMNQQIVVNEHKVGNLEKKLSTIHSIDFKAQNDSTTLKRELLELKQQHLDDEKRYQQEIDLLQQSLESKESSEKASTQEMHSLRKKLKQSLQETKQFQTGISTTDRKMQRDLMSATAEKNRFEEVLEKIQETILGGTQAQTLVEEMKQCSKTLAQADTDKQNLYAEVESLEQKLAEINTDQTESGQDNVQKIKAITRVKNLRTELNLREIRIRDIDERLSLEADRLTLLGNQLRQMNPISTISVSHNTNLPTVQSRGHQRNLSMSPHRQQPDASGEAHTPFERTAQSTFTRAQQNEPYSTTLLPRFDRESASYLERTSERPERDPQNFRREYPQQQSACSNRMSAYGGDFNQQNQDGMISSGTQQLNTNTMARLLKETKEMRRSSDHDKQHQPYGGSHQEIRDSSVGRPVPQRLYAQQRNQHETQIRHYTAQEQNLN